MYLFETKILNAITLLLQLHHSIILKLTEAWQESEASQSSHMQVLKLAWQDPSSSYANFVTFSQTFSQIPSPWIFQVRGLSWEFSGFLLFSLPDTFVINVDNTC